MREPRSIISRQISPGDYFGDEQSDQAQPWLIVRLVRAAAEGLLPAIILIAIVALFWEASVIARIFTLRYGFDVMQRVVMVTVGGGLIVSLIVYLITATRTLQGVREHQRNGEQTEAIVTLAFLTFTALVTLAPLFMALTMPQHPAP